MSDEQAIDFWKLILGLGIFIIAVLGLFYGMMAISHHFYPEDSTIQTIQTINSQESQSRDCYLNGARINCSEMPI